MVIVVLWVATEKLNFTEMSCKHIIQGVAEIAHAEHGLRTKHKEASLQIFTNLEKVPIDISSGRTSKYRLHVC